MSGLTESMHGLREAIKRQENQLTNFIKKKNLKETSMFPNNSSIEKHHAINQVSYDQLENKFEQENHSTVSNTTQASHWSCSIDTITSNITDLKQVLRSQDKNVIWLITENEELKSELIKKEKELKKQKFLLKAERETFEQYKRDTLKEYKKHKSEESLGAKLEEKPSREMIKLKSELAHYRQMYLEMDHTVNRLTKLVSTLKDDNTQLKNYLLQQEKRSNKFIYDMAKRFDISRKEWNMILSKTFESVAIPATNLAMSKIVVRNARLAYDNSMLKLELNMLRKTMTNTKSQENKLKCLTDRSVVSINTSKGHESSSDLQKYSRIGKSSGSSIVLQENNKKLELPVKNSVTTLLGRSSEQMLQMQISDKKKNFSKLNVDRWDCLSVRSGPARTESAPELYSRNIET